MRECEPLHQVLMHVLLEGKEQWDPPQLWVEAG